MWTVLMVLAIPCVIVAAVVRAVARRPRSGHEKAQQQPVVTSPEEADSQPRHTQPSPKDAAGEPIPGSRDHRREHGNL